MEGNTGIQERCGQKNAWDAVTERGTGWHVRPRSRRRPLELKLKFRTKFWGIKTLKKERKVAY